MRRLLNASCLRWLLTIALLFVTTSCEQPVTETIDVATVELTPPVATVRAGATVTLSARPLDRDGNPMAAQVLTWSSSNVTVARVSSTGVVTANAAGEVRIAVSAAGKSAVATITVTPRPVASLTITPEQAGILVARTAQLAAQPLDADGAPLAGRTITWSSSNTTVARVDADGTVTGVAPGAATIVATCEGRSAQAAVTVALPPVQTVTISPNPDTLAVNTDGQFTATLRDVNGAALTDRAVTWSSNNTTVAVVSATGVVTALTPGLAIISASAEGRSGTATVVVVNRLAGAVTVTPSIAALVIGTQLTLQTQVTDNAGNVLLGRPITYQSEAPTVASVTAAGVVTALAPGTARIVATSEGKTGTATVQVIPVPVATVQLTPATATLLTGQTVTLIARARAQDGTLLTGRTVEWRSGAAAIATVNSAGVVTAIGPGVANILATVDGVIASSTITVRPAAVAQITLTPATPVLDRGESEQMTATLRDAGGATLTGRIVTWTSSNDQVAFVSSTGLVVGFRTGTATITATSEGISASTTVTVR